MEHMFPYTAFYSVQKSMHAVRNRKILPSGTSFSAEQQESNLSFLFSAKKLEILLFVKEKEEKQKDDQRAGHINICQIKNRKVDQTEINKIYHILLHQTVIKIPKRAGDQYKCQQKRRQIMNGFRHA